MAETAPKISGKETIIEKTKLVGLEGGKGKEPKKVTAGSVPPKRLWLKIGAPITSFFMGATGVGAGFGEANKLPEPLQEEYNEAFHKDRITYDNDGTPVVDVTKTTQPTVPETTVPVKTTVQETTPPETTAEVQNKKEIKNVEELIGKINLSIDESIEKSVYPVKEVIFREPQKESEANFKKALAYAWTLVLSKRGSVNDTADKELLEIPEDQIDTRIDKLLEKINKGEDLRFSIDIKDDYANTNFYNDPSKSYTVDLTKDVDIIFYGQIPDLFTDKVPQSDGSIYKIEKSHEFMAPFIFNDKNGVGRIPCGWRFEVKEGGGLIIKISEEGLKEFGRKTGTPPSKEEDAQFVGTILSGALEIFLISGRENQNPGIKPFIYKDLYSLLMPGLIFENGLPVDNNAASIFENIYF